MKDKYDLYIHAFDKVVMEYRKIFKAGTMDSRVNRDILKKVIFYGVKLTNTRREEPIITQERVELDFWLASTVKQMVGIITTNDFMEIFPIDKTYDGEKYQTKDYLYTIDYINTLDPNAPIGDGLGFLMEYSNREVMMFNVNLMRMISDQRELDGHRSIMEEWADENDIEMYNKEMMPNGREYLVDSKGRRSRIRKPRPKYLKIVR